MVPCAPQKKNNRPLTVVSYQRPAMWRSDFAWCFLCAIFILCTVWASLKDTVMRLTPKGCDWKAVCHSRQLVTRQCGTDIAKVQLQSHVVITHFCHLIQFISRVHLYSRRVLSQVWKFCIRAAHPHILDHMVNTTPCAQILAWLTWCWVIGLKQSPHFTSLTLDCTV